MTTKYDIVPSPTRELPNRLTLVARDKRDPRSYPLGGDAQVTWLPPSLRPGSAPKQRLHPTIKDADRGPTYLVEQRKVRAARADRRAITAGGGVWWRDRAGRLRIAREPGRKKMAAAKAERAAFQRARRSMIIAGALANGQGRP